MRCAGRKCIELLSGRMDCWGGCVLGSVETDRRSLGLYWCALYPRLSVISLDFMMNVSRYADRHSRSISRQNWYSESRIYSIIERRRKGTREEEGRGRMSWWHCSVSSASSSRPVLLHVSPWPLRTCSMPGLGCARTLHPLLYSKPAGAMGRSTWPLSQPVRRRSRSITAEGNRVSVSGSLGCRVKRDCALCLSHWSTECLARLPPF